MAHPDLSRQVPRASFRGLRSGTPDVPHASANVYGRARRSSIHPRFSTVHGQKPALRRNRVDFLAKFLRAVASSEPVSKIETGSNRNSKFENRQRAVASGGHTKHAEIRKPVLWIPAFAGMTRGAKFENRPPNGNSGDVNSPLLRKGAGAGFIPSPVPQRGTPSPQGEG